MAATPRRVAPYTNGSGRQQTTYTFSEEEDSLRTPERTSANNSSTSVLASPLRAIASPLYQAVWNAKNNVLKDWRSFYGNLQATLSPRTSANRVKKQIPMTTDNMKTKLMQQKTHKHYAQLLQQQRQYDNEQQQQQQQHESMYDQRDASHGHSCSNDVSRNGMMTTNDNGAFQPDATTPRSRGINNSRTTLNPLNERHSLREDIRPRYSQYASSNSRNPFYQESLTSATPMSTPSLIVDNRDSMMMMADTPRSNRSRQSYNNTALDVTGELTPVSSLSRQFHRHQIDTRNSVLSPERPSHLSTPTPSRNLASGNPRYSPASTGVTENSTNVSDSTAALKKRLDDEKEQLNRLENKMINLRRQSQILARNGRDSFFFDEDDMNDSEDLVAATAAATPSTRENLIHTLNRPRLSLPIRTQQQSQKRFKYDTNAQQQQQFNETLNTPPHPVDHVPTYRSSPSYSPSNRRKPITTTTTTSDHDERGNLGLSTLDYSKRSLTPKRISSAHPLFSEMSTAKLRSTATINTPGGSRISNRFWKEIHGLTQKKEATSPLRLNERASFWAKRANSIQPQQGVNEETKSNGSRTPISKHSWSDTNVLTYDGDMDAHNTNTFNAKLFEIARQERNKLREQIVDNGDMQNEAAATTPEPSSGRSDHRTYPARASSSLTKRWFLEDEEDESEDNVKKQQLSKGKEKANSGAIVASSRSSATRSLYTPNRPSEPSPLSQLQQQTTQIPKKRARIESGSSVGGIDANDLFNNPIFKAAQQNMKAYETVTSGTNTAVQTTFRSGVLLNIPKSTPSAGPATNSNSAAEQYYGKEFPMTPAKRKQTPPQYNMRNTYMTPLSDELNMAQKRDEEIRKRNNIPTINPNMLAELKAKHRDRLIDDSDSYKFA